MLLTGVTSVGCMSGSAMYGTVKPSIVSVYSPKNQSLGTGVVVNSQGYIITSTHVISKKDTVIKVSDYLNNKYDYTAIVGDPMSVSLLKPKSKHPAGFSSFTDRPPLIGESAFVLGHPFGISYSFISGEISNRYIYQKRDIIQLNMNVNHGMSGAPVFNCDANIIGFILAYNSLDNSIGLANIYTDATSLIDG